MKPAYITPRADRDIDEAYLWICHEQPAAAQRFLEAVEKTCQDIAHMPGMGSLKYANVPLVFGIRMLPVRGFIKYLLFYLERDESVDIIRLLHGARDIPQALLDWRPAQDE